MITKSIAITTIAAALSAGYYLFSYVPSHDKRRANVDYQIASAAARKAAGPYIASTKEVAPGQTVQLLIYPHSTGLDMLDLKCLIYTHQEFKQSSMICPDARQLDIDQ